MEASYARLEGRNFDFYMTKRRVVIGRNSKLGDVDVNMGSSKFISRRHLDIVMDRHSFYVLCRGKNGVFVDDTFQRRENKRLQLPSSCIIRFPSTQIKFAFTSLLEDMGPLQPMHSPALPLKLDTQFTSPFVSPVPSPTGTISAVNSCPVSPSSDFRHRVPSFDLKVMAKYASKLLSNQHHQQAQMDQTEVTGELNNMTEENLITTEACLPNPGETPPTSAATVEVRDDEEEGEVEGEEEAGENHGEVPNDVLASKPGESNMRDGANIPSDKNQQKPPYSYAQLIVQALLASKDRRQTLSSIYSFISDTYPYYRLEDKGWKNSIRHNLSLNQYFMKAPREKEGLGFGKGGYWCMHPDYEEKLTAQAYVKRKKKGIPVFPSVHLVSRSAPASPTHHPLHSDISIKEMASMESKFTLPPPTTSHFTLPPFFSQIPRAAMNSSHSLPASPSRPPPGFTATPIKYFPMTAVRGHTTTDDLDMIKSHQRKIMCETIQEEHNEDESAPSEKRPRFDNHQGEGCVVSSLSNASVLPIQGITSITGPPSRAQFAHHHHHNPLQFLPISLMSAQQQQQQQQPHQNMLRAPLSSFLPQSYFSRGMVPAMPTSHSNQAPPTEVRNNSVPHSNNNEG